jgi:oligopeptide transport system substrate-binding protein
MDRVDTMDRMDVVDSSTQSTLSFVSTPSPGQKRCRRESRLRQILLGASCAAIAACSGGGPRANLVVLNGAEPESLDPAVITGQIEERAVSSLFEGLTRFNQEGVPEPGCAETWQIAPDGKTYTFKLRPTAKWSNGQPVTANDFLESWKRSLEPATAADYAYLLYPVRNAEAYNEGKQTDFSAVGVKAPDPQTLVVELTNPTPYFLDLCATPFAYAPVYLPAVKKYGDDWIKPGKLVNNGPFLLEDWQLNYRIRLRRNPDYWDKANVRLNIIDLLPIDNSVTAYNFYASKVADLILDKGLTPPSLIPELKTRPDFHAAPFLGNYFIRFNTTRPPFNDVRVRQAFCLAIDRDRLVKKITQAGEHPAYSFTPPDTGHGYEPPRILANDPARARSLLAEAGYPDGKGFPTVSYLYDNKKLNEDLAVEIQSMLADVLHVRIQLQKQEWKVYLNSMNRLDYDFCRSSWVADYNDPNTFLDCFLTGGGNNRTGWGDKEYDSLIDQTRQELDRNKRFKIFADAENRLLNVGTPICPLYYYLGIQIYDDKKFGGIEPNLLDEHPFRTMYRKEVPGV